MNQMIVSAKVWHPCGAECLIQFYGQMAPFDGMLGFRQHLAKQGWLLENPNKERPVAEEKVEEIDGIARLQKWNESSGTTSDIIAFYSANQRLKKAVAKIYLDTAEQKNAFAQLAGINPEQIPIFDGSTAPERTPLTMQKMVGVQFRITLSPNPRYDDAKARKAAQDKANGVPNAAPYTIPMRTISKYERADGTVIVIPRSQAPQQQQQGNYSQPAANRQAPTQPSGPVNGVISDPDFRKLLLAKGLTFQTALQRIDRNKKTNLAATARTVGDIPTDILSGFMQWLHGQPNAPARPTESYGNAQPDDHVDHGRIPF